MDQLCVEHHFSDNYKTLRHHVKKVTGIYLDYSTSLLKENGSSLHVDCFEPLLNFTQKEFSLRFYCNILSHPHHPLHINLFSIDLDILYENLPSSIIGFGLKMRNIIKRSTFSYANVC